MCDFYSTVYILDGVGLWENNYKTLILFRFNNSVFMYIYDHCPTGRGYGCMASLFAFVYFLYISPGNKTAPHHISPPSVC